MKINEFLKTGKGKVITIGGVAVVAVAIVIAVLLQGDGYRSILVEQVEGTVDVVGERNNGQAYAGERLYSGDDINVRDKSSLTMCMDNDKYVYADANTHFSIEASPKKDSSRIKINLDKGSELNELKSKLNAGDSYEVDTPNSTMSVRGTIFRVTVYMEDDMYYTLLEVREGVVIARLKTEDGTYNGVEQEFSAGESALIRGNFDFSEFVTDEADSVERHLDYTVLPKDSVERLVALLVNAKPHKENGEDGEIDGLKKNDESSNNRLERTDEDSKSEDESREKEKDSSELTEKKTESASDNKTEKTEEDKTEKTESKKKKSNSTKEKTTEKSSKSTSEETTEHVHNYGTWTVNTAATCTKAGSKSRTCLICGKTETESIAAEGHNYWPWSVDTAATCTKNGSKSRSCSKCGEKETAVIPATGHSYGDWEVTVQPDCVSVGKKKRTCSTCGNVENSEVPALGHDFLEVIGIAGSETKKYCTRCGIPEK